MGKFLSFSLLRKSELKPKRAIAPDPTNCDLESLSLTNGWTGLCMASLSALDW